MIDYVLLKSELIDDPDGVGYTIFLEKGSHAEIADLLNVPRGKNITAKTILSSAVLEAITAAEAESMSAAEVTFLSLILAPGAISLTPNVGLLLLSLFSPAKRPLSFAAISNLFVKTSGSRAQELFGDEVKVSNEDIAKALSDRK